MSSSCGIGRRNAIPIIYTSGTYYEVGFDVGRTFRSLIQSYLRSSTWFRETYLPAYETEGGLAAYDSTLAILKENYPHYIRELQGTADGAQVPFHHLMLLHMDNVVVKPSSVGCQDSVGGCSAISLNREGQILLGHTEDASKDMLNFVYIVSAHINEEEPQGKLGTQSERFAALSYAGHLPGYCMGYNQHGLVYSINAISPLRVFSGKTIRHFLCRALLSATTVEMAHNILRDRGTGSADGFAVNMIFMQQADNHIFQNVEVGPTEHGDESPVSIVTLSGGEHLLHTNRYLRLTSIPEEGGRSMRSSNHRHARAAQLPDPRNHQQVLELLSDTEDTLFPFFREGTVEDTGMTVALGLFDLTKKTWTIWMRNPQTTDPVMEIPLLFTWNN